MRFKLDENLPNSAADLVAAAGHEAETAAQESLEGSADSEIFAVCQKERRVLVTLDMDFADIRAYPPGSHVGIVVIRPRSEVIPLVLDALRRALVFLEAESVAGALWIVEPSRIRIRTE